MPDPSKDAPKEVDDKHHQDAVREPTEVIKLEARYLEGFEDPRAAFRCLVGIVRRELAATRMIREPEQDDPRLADYNVDRSLLERVARELEEHPPMPAPKPVLYRYDSGRDVYRMWVEDEGVDTRICAGRDFFAPKGGFAMAREEERERSCAVATAWWEARWGIIRLVLCDWNILSWDTLFGTKVASYMDSRAQASIDNARRERRALRARGVLIVRAIPATQPALPEPESATPGETDAEEPASEESEVTEEEAVEVDGRSVFDWEPPAPSP